MIKTNLEKLVEMAVSGEAAHPYVKGFPAERVAYDGGSYNPVGFSGINCTVKVGDPAFDWAGADEVSPGVAIENCCDDANQALVMLSCIGNEAVILDGKMEGKDAKLKGTPGVVTGKTSGGRVLVYFPKRVVERISVGDEIQVRAGGVGLSLLDYLDIRVMNLGPRLLKALNPSEKGGRVRIPVAKVIPSNLVGAGVGNSSSQAGEFDIQSTSAEAMGVLDQLRLGDIVAVSEYDCSHGPRWQKGAVTVGVITHGGSRRSGHGPGVNVILTTPKATIEPIITRKANIAELLGLQ